MAGGITGDNFERAERGILYAEYVFIISPSTHKAIKTLFEKKSDVSRSIVGAQHGLMMAREV